MTNRYFMKFKIFFNRAGWIYAVVFLLLGSIFMQESVNGYVFGATLSRLMPHPGYLARIVRGEEAPDKNRLEEYFHYYLKVVKYVPPRANTYSMLGFCHYYRGEKEKAVAAFKKAVELNPNFFWSYYNLGVIYFKSGRYEEAAAALKAAIETDADVNLGTVYFSKMYRPIIDQMVDFRSVSSDNLSRAFRQCYKMLVLSHYNLKQFPEVLLYSRAGIELELKGGEFFYYYAGVAAAEVHEYEKAVVLLQNAIQLNPDYPEPRFALTRTLKRLGRDAVQDSVAPAATSDVIPREDRMDVQIF